MNVKELAEQAGLDFYEFAWTSPTDDFLYPEGVSEEALERFAALVAAQTRARCIELVLAGSAMPVQTRTLEALQRDRKRIAKLIEEEGK